MGRILAPGPRFSGGPLLAVEDVSYSYRALERPVQALRGVSFSIRSGETLAVIGESGSGKSTLARIVCGLLSASEGRLRFRGQDIGRPVEKRPRPVLRQIQMIFQNPDASLNPRHTVRTLLERPLRHFLDLSGQPLRARIEDLLADVRLPTHYRDRYPAELSGGERQRVAIARALAAEPDLLVCDEITSALDVSVQGSLLDLLKEIQRRSGVSMLFITHDLALARWFADRAIVLYRGLVCEDAPIPEIFLHPQHAYTARLIDAVRPLGSFDPAGGDPARPDIGAAVS